MKKFFRISAIVVILLIGLIFILSLFIKSYLRSDRLKAILIPRLEEMTGRKVLISEIEASLFKGIVVKEISIKEIDGGDFVKTREFVLKYSLLPLLKKELVINEIRIISPHIYIKRNRNGLFNFNDILERLKKRAESQWTGKKGKTSMEGLPLSIITDKIFIQDAYVEFLDDKSELPMFKGVMDARLSFSLARGQSLPHVSGNILIKKADILLNHNSIKTTGELKIDKNTIFLDLIAELQGDRLDIKGNIYSYLKAPDIKVDIYSKSIDLEKLGAFLSASKKGDRKGSASVPEGAKNRSRDSRQLRLTASGQLKVDNALYRGYRIKDFILRYQYKDDVLLIKPLEFNLRGGDVVDAEGTAEGEFRLLYSISAPEPAALARRSLVGRLHAKLTKGEMRRSKITDALSAFTGLKELRQLSFEKAWFLFKVNNQKVNVTGEVNSRHLKLTPEGVVSFDQSMDLKVLIQLSPELSNKLSVKKKLKFIEDDKGWLSLPLRLTGSLQKPRVGLDQEIVEKTIIKGISEKKKKKR